MPEVARGSASDSVNTGHGCDTSTTTDKCSDSVFAKGIGVCRKDDTITTHNTPSGNNCVPHTPKITAGSGTVFANGRPIARNGDAADSGSISSGADTVFAGG